MATNRPWIKMEIGRLQPSIDVISSDVILRHNHVIGHVIRANQCHFVCMVAEVKLIAAISDYFSKMSDFATKKSEFADSEMSNKN